MPRPLDADEVSRQLADLPGWSGDTAGLTRSYSFASFGLAVSCVDQVAVEAETMDHHPDMDIRWRTLAFALSTHSAGGVTQLDIELAHRIHGIASELGGA